MEESEFPPNTRTNKEIPTTGPQEDKVIEKVVTGKVVRRKKPLGRRFMDTFFGGEAKGVGHYVLFEVLIPAAKDVTADAVSQAIERMLFGEARSSSRRTGLGPRAHGGHVSYNRYSSSPAPWRREPREEPRSVSRRARAVHDFDEIILATRTEAEEVIDRLFDLISRYEQATVSDLYDLVGIAGNFTDEKWGWTDIRGSGVTRITSGYLLDLPKPEPLD